MTTLPVTTLSAGILGVMTIVLSVNVVLQRVRSRVSLGARDDDRLLVSTRIFGNFVEYVPIALILLALCEVNSTSERMLWTIAGLLIAGRFVHLFGVSATRSVTVARVVGMTLTWVSIGIASVLALLHALS